MISVTISYYILVLQLEATGLLHSMGFCTNYFDIFWSKLPFSDHYHLSISSVDNGYQLAIAEKVFTICHIFSSADATMQLIWKMRFLGFTSKSTSYDAWHFVISFGWVGDSFVCIVGSKIYLFDVRKMGQGLHHCAFHI